MVTIPFFLEGVVSDCQISRQVSSELTESDFLGNCGWKEKTPVPFSFSFISNSPDLSSESVYGQSNRSSCPGKVRSQNKTTTDRLITLPNPE